MTMLVAASEYCRRGWRVVPVVADGKRPTRRGWPDLRIGLADIPQWFASGENIAAILGARSAGLADIDLDCDEALALGDLYLPQTGAVFGRPSRPGSHRLYFSPGALFEALSDPIAGKVLVELRADGRDGGAHLTLLPPSIADGERREWDGDVMAPAVVDPAVLARRVAWLAIGCLTMRYVSTHAAEQPGPDLPRLLRDFDRQLGAAAFRWLGEPDADAPARHSKPERNPTRAEIDLAGVGRCDPKQCGLGRLQPYRHGDLRSVKRVAGRRHHL